MKIFITGIAGFIGCNVAKSFADAGHKVYGIDNLSRVGVSNNLNWLNSYNNIYATIADIRKSFIIYNPDVIFHFASQTGVMPSIENPVEDFGVNALATVRLLECARKMSKPPLVIYASTNKVYGDISVDKPVNEKQPLSFCSPYGCSKGTGDQYMLDYYRIYKIPTVVLRMSCIYGKRQLGTEQENGWLCHFAKNVDKPVTVYGDGTQVRDILYIDDYVRLMHLLVENKDKVAGQAFNIGGGEANTISVNMALHKIGNMQISFEDWRPSDQKYYVSDLTKITNAVGWKPEIGVDEGLERLKKWVKEI